MTPCDLAARLRRLVVCGTAVCAIWISAALAVEAPPPPPDGAPRFTQPDGKWFVVGSVAFDSEDPRTQAFAIWKRNADGTPDASFNGDGFATIPIWGDTERAQGLAVQPDGRIVVAGQAYDPTCDSYLCDEAEVGIVRLNPDGTLDGSFNGDGRIVIAMVCPLEGSTGLSRCAPGSLVGFDRTDVTIRDDGTIEIGGGTSTRGNMNYLRLRPDGALLGAVDNVFGHFDAVEILLPQAQGLWWAAPAGSESGWGLQLAHQGDTIFATWYTYDASGKPWWLSATLTRTSGASYRGTLYQARGPALDASPFDPARVTRTAVGDATLTFTGRDEALFGYTVNGSRQEKAVVRQAFGPLPVCAWGTERDLARATNYQDLWWATPAGSESGWGLQLAHQGDTIFATWYAYGADGAPLWLSGTATKVADGRYEGALVRTTGPAFDARPWESSRVTRTEVGAFALAFADGNSGTFSYRLSLDNATVEQSKAITRQVFRAPGTTCR